MLGDDLGFLLVDGDGGDLGAVDFGEELGVHVGHGALFAADADEAAALGDDAGFLEFVERADHEVGAVGVGGLLGDVEVFFLVGGGEVGDVLVEALDDDLVVFKFGEEFGYLGFLLGGAFLEAGDVGLEFGVLAVERGDLGVEFGYFFLVAGHDVVD